MVLLAEITGQEVAEWVLAILALVSVIFFFYFGVTNKKKNRNLHRLLEMVFLLIMVIHFVVPIIYGNFKLLHSNAFIMFSLSIYLIYRVVFIRSK